MRYLRMLINSVIAAALATAYIVFVVLALNPAVPLTVHNVQLLVATVGLYYVANLTAVAYVLLVLRQLFARELFSPAWASVGVLVWLGALAAACGAALMWRNFATFELVLEPAAARALARSAAVLALAAMLFLAIGATRSGGSTPRAVTAALWIVVASGSLAVPLALRGTGVPAPLEARRIDVSPAQASVRPGRVTVIAIDAASLDFVTNATAEGRLPNFGKLLDGGAVRHLATIHPTSAEAVWASVATGKFPQKNGIHSAGLYRIPGSDRATDMVLELLPEYCFAHGLVRLGFLVEEAHSSTAFRTSTLWSILSSQGVTVGVSGWPLTQPAPAVRGFLVSDAFHRIARTPSGLENPGTVYPADLLPSVTAALESLAADDGGGEDAPARVDRISERIWRMLIAERPVQVAVMRYQSLDPIGHHYLRYATPSEFGDVADEDRRRLGDVLEHHYAIVDQALGSAIAGVGPDDLLIVISGYGMVPLPFEKRAIERLIGDPEMSGTHDSAPDGFLIAYGPSVATGRSQTRASVVDVVPTLLYFLGLAVGRDMDGFVRTDLFKRSFLQDRPITYIPTYDR